MARSLTAAFKAALISPDCDEVGITLLTISHASFSQTYYVCDNNEDITHNGQVYSAYAFDIAFVDEVEGEIPSQYLVFDNVDTTIFTAIQQLSSTEMITVTQKFIVASNPNTNLLSRTITYKVANVDVDELTVQASLILAVISNDAIPWLSATPAIWPGLAAART